MAIVVVGLNHRTAPVGLLERLAIGDDKLQKGLHQLATYEHILEGVILSTCNRIEVYAEASRFHGGAQDLRNFLAEFCHVAPEDFADHLYTYHDDGAIRHLFRVVSGIDSLVVGESEILGQVRRSFQIASEEGVAQRALGSAFRQALRVGKRARTETAIGRNPTSVSSAAVDLARRALGRKSLSDTHVLIVGAGKMGRLAVRSLVSAGANSVTVMNRGANRGRELAAAIGGTTRPFDELIDALAEAEIVISSTTAPQAVIERSDVEEALQRRVLSSPLFIVDIAVPRDVDDTVRDMDGVVLRDIDDLRGVVESNMGGRMGEVANVEQIIAAEVDHWVTRQREGEVAPAVSALVARGEQVRIEELARIRRRLEGMSEEQRRTVELLASRIVAKLLHTPIERARGLAGSKQGHVYLDALRELFELEDGPEAL